MTVVDDGFAEARPSSFCLGSLRITSQIPNPEMTVPRPISQDSGSPNIAQAHTRVSAGLRYSTLATRAVSYTHLTLPTTPYV